MNKIILQPLCAVGSPQVLGRGLQEKALDRSYPILTSGRYTELRKTTVFCIKSKKPPFGKAFLSSVYQPVQLPHFLICACLPSAPLSLCTDGVQSLKRQYVTEKARTIRQYFTRAYARRRTVPPPPQHECLVPNRWYAINTAAFLLAVCASRSTIMFS